MSAPTPDSRGAAFWNGTMGHAWVSQQAAISDVFTSVTSISFNAAAATAGEYVVDIGCGTGDTLLDFAKVVGPSGAALGVDVSVPMLSFARHRAAEAGYRNVSCALADAMTYAFEPRWADLMYSRFGVMFFDDPVKAFTNIREARRPAGVRLFPHHAGDPVVSCADRGRAAAFAGPTASGSPGTGNVFVCPRGSRPRDSE